MFTLLTATESAISINLDLALIISIGLAVAAAVSPIFVAIINNHHTRKLRIKELEHAQALRIEELKHEQELKKLDAETCLAQKRIDIEFTAKRAAFEKLFACISAYLSSEKNPVINSELIATAYSALSMCTRAQTRKAIDDFIYAFTKKPEYIDKSLENLSASIAAELYSPDPITMPQRKM